MIMNIQKINKKVSMAEKVIEKSYEKSTTGKWYGMEKTTIRCGSGAIVRTQLLGEIDEKEIIELLGVQ